MNHIILTINPGSTSTKIALYRDTEKIVATNISHSAEAIATFPNIISQLDYRKKFILEALKDNGIDLSSIQIIVARGGLIRPISSGVYEVNDTMIKDLHEAKRGEHACNLGAILAKDIASTIGNGVKAYIADPVVVDEMNELARISGHPEFNRLSVFHALNQKAIARTYAKDNGKRYDDLNLIVAHMGGGVSIGAHEKGKVVDVNNALDGDGPFSPERSGSLPVGALVDLCFSGKKSYNEIKKMIVGAGGMVAYTGTNDARVVETRAQNDPECKLIQEAFCYQVAKEIGSAATVLKGKVDAILLTGGMAYGKEIVRMISERTEFIAPIAVYPGEDEMKALALNGYMLLNHEIEPSIY